MEKTSKSHVWSSHKKSSSSSVGGERSSKKSHRKKKRHKSKRDKSKPGKDSESPEIVSDTPFSPGFESDASINKDSRQTVSASAQQEIHSHTLGISGTERLLTKRAARQMTTSGLFPNVNTNQSTRKSPSTNGVPYQSMSATSISTKLNGRPSSQVSKAASQTNTSQNTKTDGKNPESLRWELELSDSEEEAERLKIYKLNRRKRYLAASNKKYSDRLASCSSTSIGSTNMGADSALHVCSSSSVTKAHGAVPRSQSKDILYKDLIQHPMQNQQEMLCQM